MMSDVGDFVVLRHTEPDGSEWLEVVQADHRIAITRELLEQAARDELPWIVQDGPFVGILGEYGYRATGETRWGEPVFECVTRP